MAAGHFNALRVVSRHFIDGVRFTIVYSNSALMIFGEIRLVHLELRRQGCKVLRHFGCALYVSTVLHYLGLVSFISVSRHIVYCECCEKAQGKGLNGGIDVF